MNSNPITIFLIDDDEDDRDFFNIALSETNYGVQFKTARTANEALKMLYSKEVSPDFIFLDLNMPGMDGRSCLQELKKNIETKHIPVIIFTTSSAQKDIIETKHLGAADFITKPSNLDKLTTALKHFLKRNLKNNNEYEERSS